VPLSAAQVRYTAAPTPSMSLGATTTAGAAGGPARASVPQPSSSTAARRGAGDCAPSPPPAGAVRNFRTSHGPSRCVPLSLLRAPCIPVLWNLRRMGRHGHHGGGRSETAAQPAAGPVIAGALCVMLVYCGQQRLMYALARRRARSAGCRLIASARAAQAIPVLGEGPARVVVAARSW